MSASLSASNEVQPTTARKVEGPSTLAPDANAENQPANQHRESPTLASEATTKTNTQEAQNVPDNPDQAFNRWQLYTLNDALTAEDVPWDWAIDGMLLRQAALLCSGQPHAGKSLNWLAAAMGSVIEHKVWGHFDSSSVKRVLFIETEDPKQVLDKRIQQLAKGFGVDPGKLADVGFFYARPGPFDIANVMHQKSLKTMITNCNPDWCVISTLQGLIPGKNWKEQLDMARVNAFVVDLASKCCPIVMITHSPQDKSAKRAAGTITQEANYLTVMHFEKKGLVTSVTVDSKIGESIKFDVTLETDGKEVRAVQHSEAVQSRQQAVIELRKANPDATQKQIAELAKCSLRTVQLADAEVKKAEGRKLQGHNGKDESRRGEAEDSHRQSCQAHRKPPWGNDHDRAVQEGSEGR
jgi:RecA-family ATPase